MSSIYALSDPRTNEIRYVGQTARGPSVRASEHLSSVLTKKRQQTNELLGEWIESLHSIGLRPEVVVLETDPPGGLKEAEKAWIACLLRYGCCLVNIADGAVSRARKPHGLLGHKAAVESRAKMSVAKKGKKQNLAAYYGIEHDRDSVAWTPTRRRCQVCGRKRLCRPVGPLQRVCGAHSDAEITGE